MEEHVCPILKQAVTFVDVHLPIPELDASHQLISVSQIHVKTTVYAILSQMVTFVNV